MTEPETNPHLLEQAPGSWDPPFRKWVLGVALPVALLVPALRAMLAASASIPMPVRGSRGIVWMPAEGLMAITWGCALAGVAVALHGRYHWRYRRTGWERFEMVQTIGLVMAVIGLGSTVAQFVIQTLR